MFGPFHNYGFEYKYQGRQFSFVVPAESEAEARGRAAAMSGAAFVGVLVPSSANDPIHPAAAE